MARKAFGVPEIKRRGAQYKADVEQVRKAGYDPTLDTQWINMDLCFLDESYQRPPKPSRVAAIARHFDPDALGVFHVSKRKNGKYAVLDGGTRWTAMKEVGWSNIDIPAVVYEGLSVQREAELWNLMNAERSKPNIDELFRSAVTAGQEEALLVAKVLDTLGLTSEWASNEDNNLRAIKTAWGIVVAEGPRLLERALTIMIDAWYGQERAMHGGILRGTAMFLSSNPDVDDARLVQKAQSMTPVMLLARASAIKNATKLDFANGVAAVLTDLYNAGLSKNRVPDWKHRSLKRNYKWRERGDSTSGGADS